jgi:hypothetical protein
MKTILALSLAAVLASGCTNLRYIDTPDRDGVAITGLSEEHALRFASQNCHQFGETGQIVSQDGGLFFRELVIKCVPAKKE